MSEAKTKLQKYSAPALEKGLDILELLSLRSGGGLSQSEIAEGVGRSKNEIFRMMVVLEERGYIKRSDGDVFLLTSKLGELSGPRNDTSRMLEIARPIMTRLSEQTKLSNHLWILNETNMQVAASASASESYSLALSEGAQSSVFGSSAGACFLSALPDTESRLKALRDRGEYVNNEAFLEYDARVEACRKDGVCVLPNAEAIGILEISAPLSLPKAEDVVGALTVPIIGDRDSKNEIANVIKTLKHAVNQVCAKMASLAVFQTAHSPAS
ncbi:helix-turn-helix domain-containing protein [Nitratireductor sp. XY-223]|uniref:IclR family transcriptional regulator n=1 Tax=Nitratireductor sp. XY-223 TaxID=2561926 RepID=UPI00145AFAE0|nr:helix-turn-helix domain-containing protein [Nitratireductor sp. XY-223]